MGLGAPWTDGDPALGVFPERAPATRRWCFADQFGPHFLEPQVVEQEQRRGTGAP